MIKPTAMFPVLVVDDLSEIRDFYEEIFGFQPVYFDPDFYLHLLHAESGVQLGFLKPDLANQPNFLHTKTVAEGMVISIEVSDARSALAAAMQKKLNFAMDYKEESWGQNHFMVKDPAGLILDIVENVDQA